ncbi:hypothetical protein SAMN04490196_0783 [Pseudomonas moraviensis]|nr:hypothetical protein SAMN04490196_0783 [Pseudomonas moraviensis]
MQPYRFSSASYLLKLKHLNERGNTPHNNKTP